MSYNICCLCGKRGECYTNKYSSGKYCLSCVEKTDWIFSSLIKEDKKKIKKLLKQRKQEQEEVELEEEITVIGDKYDDFYDEIKNVKRIKEKERYCKFCKKKKLTRYKIDETEHDKEYDRKAIFHVHAICISCLGFIAGMDNFAKAGRCPPP